MLNERLPDQIHLDGFKEYMRYDSDTGRIVWKKIRDRRGNAVLGGDVGSAGGKNRYRKVVVHWSGERRHFQVHRIAWFLYYGEWAPRQIDHIDKDTFNNRISPNTCLLYTSPSPRD